MAESKRSKSSRPALDDEAQKRRDRILLWTFLIGAVVIVAGMFLLAGFLSGS